MAKYCPRCGYPNPDDALFCARCGYRLPQQTSQPPYTPTSQPPYTPNYPPSKRRKMTIIGGLIAVLILLIAFIVISPSLLTPTSVELYSPSQASTNFGGSWILCDSKTMVIYHNGLQYYVKYYNGTTMSETNTNLIESYFLGSIQIPCIVYFTSASIETLNSSNNGQPITLGIAILHYENNSIPSAVLNKIKFYVDFLGAFGNATVLCPEYNGFNTLYIGVQYPTSANVGENPFALLVASGNNELVIIAINGEYASLGQMENVLSAVT